MIKAPNAPFPFNDDEIAADPTRYRQFLAYSAIGAPERATERSRVMAGRAKKRARRTT